MAGLWDKESGMPQDSGGSISAAGGATDVPGPEAHAEACELVSLGIPIPPQIIQCSSTDPLCGLTDPPHQMHPQFCGEKKRHIKERNKDNKSLHVSAGQVLLPVSY